VTPANSRGSSIERMGIIKLPTLQHSPERPRRRSLICFSTPSTVLFFLLNPLCIDCTAEAASSGVIFISVFISDLSSRFTTPKTHVKPGPHIFRLFSCLPILPAFLEAGIQIRADDTLVQLGSANVLHAVESVLVVVIFDKAETAGGLLESIEAHDKSLDLATSVER
jgi:hypothetical protein